MSWMNQELTCQELAILCVLREFPIITVTNICANAGVARGTVIKALKDLKALGLIESPARSCYRVLVQPAQKEPCG